MTFILSGEGFELEFRTPTAAEFAAYVDGIANRDKRESAQRNLINACGGAAALAVVDRWPALLDSFSAEIDDECSGNPEELALKPFEPVDGFTPTGDTSALRLATVAGATWVLARPSGPVYEAFKSSVARGKIASGLEELVIDCVRHPGIDAVKAAIAKTPGMISHLGGALRELAGANMVVRKKKTPTS